MLICTCSLLDFCKIDVKKKKREIRGQVIFIIIYYDKVSNKSTPHQPKPSNSWRQNYLGVRLHYWLEWTRSSCVPLCWAQSMWTVSGIYILHKPPRIHSSGNIWGFHLLWYRSSEPFLKTPTPCCSKCGLLSSYR